MKERQLLQMVLTAWDSLPGDRRYSPKDIEIWLKEKMKPAIDEVRKEIGCATT